jgi:hypothetical protein
VTSSAFDHLRAALLLVLGLGITQLLSALAAAFRVRRRLGFHWLPLTWAAVVFAWQMQFLWAIYELRGATPAWTPVRFGLLLAMALLLFVAGALVAPSASPEEPPLAWDQFQKDGRWALPCLAAYFLLAFLANPVLFGVPLFLRANLADLGLSLLAAASLLVRSRAGWAGLTAAFVACSAAAIALLSPGAYRQ